MKNSLKLLMLFALAFTSCANVLDDGKARLYACDRDAGPDACPEGWTCGLSGYCQDPTQTLPYKCESSADCSRPWHCGGEGVCYDRASARDRACRLELETIPDAGDCAPGWRCGREVRGQVCHPLDAGAAYSCMTDQDCEANWRCGSDSLCVDVEAQGLRVNDAVLAPSKVSPLLPSQVDVLQLRVAPSPQFSVAMSQLVFTSGNTLTFLTNPTSLSSMFTGSRATAPLLRTPHALAATDSHVLVTDATGLVDYFDALDGGSPVLVNSMLANAELRYAPVVGDSLPPRAQEELAAFTGTTVALCGRSAAPRECDPSTFESVTLPVSIRDVAFVDDDGFQRRPVLASTSEGPFFAPRAGSSFLTLDGGTSSSPVWRPMALPGLSDACSATHTALDRLAYDEGLRMLAVTSDQNRTLSLFNRPFTPHTIAPCAELAFDAEYGPCSVCGPGERLVKLGTDLSLADRSAVALCQLTTADGGERFAAYRHHAADGGCSLEPMSLPASVSAGYRTARETFGLQGIDAVGAPRACPQAGCDTMLFGRAPDRVAGGPAQLGVHSDDVIDQNSHTGQPSGVTTPLGIERVLHNVLSSAYVAGSVVEQPDWMIGSSGSTATVGDQEMMIQLMSQYQPNSPLNRSFVRLSRSSDLLPSIGGGGLGLIDATATKAFGTITTDAENKPWLIVGAGDRIWAEDARLISEDGGLRTINIKTVPIPSAEIQSMAFAAFERGDAGTGPLLEGYTVEQNRLFHVRVHTAELWLPDEIRIGETGIVPVAVWMEGKRGRVGTRDGRVFGLPIPVPLSPPIPEAPLPTVLNYGSLCGQGFALSSTALYRLSSVTKPVGTWERVSLEMAQPGLDSFDPHWSSTMHKARVGNVEHLYLFSETGLAIDVSATCSP